MKFPAMLVDINPENRNKDWEVDLKVGGGLFFERYFQEAPKGWFIGLQTSVQNFEIRSQGASANFNNLLVMPNFGYVWYPFENNLYLRLWSGIGYTQKISGQTKVNNKTYDVFPLIPFGAIHIGYRF